MCIRDSQETAIIDKMRAELNLPRLAFDVVIDPEMAQEEPQQSRPQTCLLYTSDAADERSSVDLGGRRIIKKKKNIHDYAGRHSTDNKQ